MRFHLDIMWPMPHNKSLVLEERSIKSSLVHAMHYGKKKKMDIYNHCIWQVVGRISPGMESVGSKVDLFQLNAKPK